MTAQGLSHDAKNLGEIPTGSPTTRGHQTEVG